MVACTMTAPGNPSISRVLVLYFYSSTSSSVVKCLCGDPKVSGSNPGWGPNKKLSMVMLY